MNKQGGRIIQGEAIIPRMITIQKEGGVLRRLTIDSMTIGMTHYYAGFWRRFGAFWVDFLIFLPLIILNYRLYNYCQSKYLAVSSFVLYSALYHFYVIYCHGRWGRTIGKLATGIRITSHTFEPISWRQAILRSSVDVSFTIISCVGTALAFSAMPDDAIMATSGLDRAKLLLPLHPTWDRYADWGQQAWVWGEFVVMMTNSKRRALHDFIAGTVVVQERGVTKKQLDKDDPFLKDFSKDLKRFNTLKNPF
jgi:uncharacterized RDD family membrane protein YckC